MKTAGEAEIDRSSAVARQAAIGLGLAGAMISGWLAVHAGAVFGLDLAQTPIIAVLLIIAVQTWLSVGLFIVAHDAMHGSLAPFRPGVNRFVGRIALGLYAGFNYDRLVLSHFAHHRHAGTELDPDFDARHPASFLPWFLTFFVRYLTLPQLAVQAAVAFVYLNVLGVALGNLLLFWALPALLAAVQLFYFGTYRPHRHDGAPFADRHRARSDDWPAWLSLLACFHFGLHHEHHEAPTTPWWRLPALRRKSGR